MGIKNEDDGWITFLKSNPLYAIILVFLVFLVVSLAPFEPSICTGDEQNPCKYIVRYHLVNWLFAFVDKYSGAIGALATIAIAAYTVVLARVSNRQANLINKSIEESAKATKHAETSAAAAQEQARIAWQAINANERAWISLSIHDFDDFKPTRVGGAEIMVKLTVKNIGKTPAVHAHSCAWMVVTHKDAHIIARDLAADVKSVNIEHSRMVLPQEEYQRPWGVTMPSNVIGRGFRPGDAFLPVIVACTTYQTLPDLSLHQTVVCYSLSLKGEEGRSGGLITVGSYVAKEQLSVDISPGGFAD